MYKICFVEDEKNLHSLIKSYLEKEGYEVLSCYNGKQALESINHDIQLWILVDMIF